MTNRYIVELGPPVYSNSSKRIDRIECIKEVKRMFGIGLVKAEELVNYAYDDYDTHLHRVSKSFIISEKQAASALIYEKGNTKTEMWISSCELQPHTIYSIE